jgi:hypothetical protein
MKPRQDRHRLAAPPMGRPTLERIGLGGVRERPTLRTDGDRTLARRIDLQRLATRRAGGR